MPSSLAFISTCSSVKVLLLPNRDNKRVAKIIPNPKPNKVLLSLIKFTINFTLDINPLLIESPPY